MGRVVHRPAQSGSRSIILRSAGSKELRSPRWCGIGRGDLAQHRNRVGALLVRRMSFDGGVQGLALSAQTVRRWAGFCRARARGEVARGAARRTWICAQGGLRARRAIPKSLILATPSSRTNSTLPLAPRSARGSRRRRERRAEPDATCAPMSAHSRVELAVLLDDLDSDSAGTVFDHQPDVV